MKENERRNDLPREEGTAGGSLVVCWRLRWSLVTKEGEGEGEGEEGEGEAWGSLSWGGEARRGHIGR